MYNEHIKKEYLENKSDSVTYILSNIFAKSEIYENIKGKDVCDFVEFEILEFLTGLASSSLATLAGYTSLLRGYTQWCCDNNINADHINHYDMVTLDMLDVCVDKIINDHKHITVEELKKVMDNIVNVCDRALVYSIFYGICGKDCIELINIRENDIDRYNNKIKLATDREIYVPTDLCDMLSQSCNTYDYVLTSTAKIDSLPLSQNDESPFKMRSNSRFSTPERAKLRLFSRLLKIREDTGCVALTIDRLKTSGMIHHMKKAMENNPKLNKENIFTSKEMEEIQKRYGCEHLRSFTLKAKYKDCL